MSASASLIELCSRREASASADEPLGPVADPRVRGQRHRDLVPRQRPGHLLGARHQGVGVGVGAGRHQLRGESRGGVAGAQGLDGLVGGLVVEVVEAGHGERMPAQPEFGRSLWRMCEWKARPSSGAGRS